jgi:signal transduction histidine kinase
MDAVDTVLRWAQLVEWVLLAAAAFNLWRKRRDESATWLACTFASLAVVVVAGMIIGQDSTADGAMFWVIKGLLAVIVLFPYLLYRFLVSIVQRARWVWITAHVLTGTVLVTSLLMPSFPDPDAPRPWWLQVWMILFLAQWIFLLGRVAWQLWRAGRGQPPVARRRMRTMGTGSFVLAGVIALSAFGSPDNTVTVFGLVVQSFGLIAGPLFLFGFAPPGLLRAQWRRKEEADLRAMEIGVVKALSREEIADTLLPAVVNLLGGRGAALIGAEGDTLGLRGLTAAEVDSLRRQIPVVTDPYEVLKVGDAHVIPMEAGQLIVMSGPFTPFFGIDELQMLSASAVLADLALGRAKLFELEQQAREAMRDFVAIASHDLRTPVTVIQGFSEVLGEHWDSITEADKKDYSEAINRQAQVLDRLIRDLLTVSRLDVDEVDVEPQRVDVVEAANDTVKAIASGIEVTVSGEECPLAFADPDHVARMLQNYVKNALVYGQAPYAVDVIGSADSVTVYVRDHGVGVSEAFRPHLFEKFARADRKKSRSVQGTGLGLSIVRGLARANGGEAWYEHRNGSGACFAFRLPRAPADKEGIR